MIYAYMILIDYTTNWHANFFSSVYYTLNRAEPGCERSLRSYIELPDFPVSNLLVFLLSKSVHEEATMVFYSLGTFHFSPPYRWHRCVNRFPNSNITDRMMHVELSYNLNMGKMLIIDTQRSRNAAEWFSSAWSGPAALFTGNTRTFRSPDF